jgi:hypothetical protein
MAGTWLIPVMQEVRSVLLMRLRRFVRPTLQPCEKSFSISYGLLSRML